MKIVLFSIEICLLIDLLALPIRRLKKIESRAKLLCIHKRTSARSNWDKSRKRRRTRRKTTITSNEMMKFLIRTPFFHDLLYGVKKRKRSYSLPFSLFSSTVFFLVFSVQFFVVCSCVCDCCCHFNCNRDLKMKPQQKKQWYIYTTKWQRTAHVGNCNYYWDTQRMSADAAVAIAALETFITFVLLVYFLLLLLLCFGRVFVFLISRARIYTHSTHTFYSYTHT